MNAAPVTIRPEGAEAIGVIYALTRRAFARMPYAAGDEQDLIDALSLSLSLSLVAECGGEVAGHIALSPMTPKGWFALGPVSVEPALQRQGIGSALDPGACPADQPPKYFMALCFGALRPSGLIAFHRLFNGLP